MAVDTVELVGPATVVEVAVGEHNLQRLLSVGPQLGELQEVSQVVNSDTSVHQQVRVSSPDDIDIDIEIYKPLIPLSTIDTSTFKT